MGYLIVGFALLLFVQARNVFPQLLLARLLFSVGGAATSTMVTAILPSMILPPQQEEGEPQGTTTPPISGHGVSPSISSELTITPQRLQRHGNPTNARAEKSPTRLAGIVGLFTGCGALISLAIFLRLPELIQRTGTQPGQALADSYYIVGALSLALSIICLIGLRRLRGEDGKGWSALMYGKKEDTSSYAGERVSALWSFLDSVMLGFKSPSLGLGYLGGFVARASSVGISLFIPLYVNAYYISSGRCDEFGHNPEDIKDHCRDAYALAAELTGVSQLIALLCAPVFGFLADRYRRYNAPLLVAALVGALGYVLLASLESPMISGEEGSPWVFVIMALLGISQIGAIVCSLGLLGRCVLGLKPEASKSRVSVGVASARDSSSIAPNHMITADQEGSMGAENHTDEASPLLETKETTQPRGNLKGSIAGVYSLAGGVGILLLTKAGGVLFDRVSSVAPFAMLAGFNLLLLMVGIGQGVSTAWRSQGKV